MHYGKPASLKCSNMKAEEWQPFPNFDGKEYFNKIS